MKIVERIKYLVSHKFVQSAAVLQAGGIAGTVVQAISGVVIARLLKPELFGQYSIAFSVASIVTIFLGAGVQDAIAPQTARAWTTGDRRSLDQALGFWAKFTLANVIATLAVVLFLPFITGHIYHSSVMGSYAAVVVIASLISTTVFTLVQLMLQIVGRIRALSTITLADVAVRYGASVGLIIAGLGIWGAVSGHLFGAGILCAISVILYRGLVRTYPELPDMRRLWELARAVPWRPLIGPTLWVMLDRNLGMLYGALPVAMVGLYAKNTEVAYFKLAFGYIILAMSVLGPISTLLNVHFPTVQVRDGWRLRNSFIRVTLYATGLSAIVTFVVLAISPLVFRVLYGVAYLPSVPYVMGFGLFGALFGLGIGLGPMWRAVGKVQVSIVINLLTLGLGIPLGIWLITVWHIWGAVAMVTLWYTISHMASFLYLLRALKNRPQ